MELTETNKIKAKLEGGETPLHVVDIQPLQGLRLLSGSVVLEC
jgi:hypothetical protein